MNDSPSSDPTVGAGAAHDGAVLALIDFDPGTGRTLGHHLVDPRAPHLHVLDLSATRGDGVFETVSLGSGRPQALEPHLHRFGSSASLLDLPDPDRGVWRAAIVDVADRLAGHAEAFVKIVLSRGVEGGTAPTGWVWGEPSPDHSAARGRGIAVAVLDRGLRHDVAQTSPWLLAGAKSLSYAVNKAVLREAARRGADDALFVSSDGFLLEGAVSNLVLRVGDRLVTPRTDIGILPGTTQADVFRFARDRGMPTGFGMLTRADLDAADGAWLVSSVRHAAPLRAVDGVERPVDHTFSEAVNAFLVARTE